MVFTQIRYGKISPLLLFSGVMVLVLGGITIWLHDETFIKIKPTIYYLFVAGLLGVRAQDQAQFPQDGARQRLPRPQRQGLEHS